MTRSRLKPGPATLLAPGLVAPRARRGSGCTLFSEVIGWPRREVGGPWPGRVSVQSHSLDRMGTATGDVKALRLTPPAYCQYVGEACDQSFTEPAKSRVFFAYPSSPSVVAGTISSAIETLKQSYPRTQWLSWEDMDIQGQMIYCQVCASMRASAVFVADVSTLNFNVMFEIGYAIGLGLPIFLIRDTSIGMDKRAFRDIGVLDTLGHLEFVNSQELVVGLAGVPGTTALPEIAIREYRNQPIYLLKSPIAVDGSISLQATLKKARLGYRSFDPVETPRLSGSSDFR